MLAIIKICDYLCYKQQLIKKTNMQELEQKLGYTYKNKNLLQQALTHTSFTPDIHFNYERLEFLGDRILGVTIADMLFKAFKNEAEGKLAQRFVKLVCKQSVADVMRNLGVSKHIIAANPELNTQDSVLCDVGEALIASIYLDSKSMETAETFVRRNWLPLIDSHSEAHKDYKTFLQEYAAEKGLPAPLYIIKEKTGPEHAPEFLVEVSLGADHLALGRGKNKKQAEQTAASQMLLAMGVDHV